MIARSIIAIMGYFSFATAVAFAQGAGRLLVEERVTLEIEPSEVVFLIVTEANPRGILIPGVAVPAPLADNQATDQLGKLWLVGAVVTPNVKQYSVLIRDDAGELVVISGHNVSASASHKSPDSLRDELDKSREQLKSWQLQSQTQESSLTRLRADAEVIGNLGRIVEVRDEVQAIKLQLARLEADINNVNQTLKFLHNYPTPQSHLTREAQLTKQIAELASVAKLAESSEFGRRTQAESETQARLSLIEQTRTESLEDLNLELIKIRRRRMQLERSSSSQSEDPSA